MVLVAPAQLAFTTEENETNGGNDDDGDEGNVASCDEG